MGFTILPDIIENPMGGILFRDKCFRNNLMILSPLSACSVRRTSNETEMHQPIVIRWFVYAKCPEILSNCPQSLWNVEPRSMNNTCGADAQKLAVLQATEPELVATLLEIDRAKQALRGHSCIRSSSKDKVFSSSGSKWTQSKLPGYQSALAPTRWVSAESPGSKVNMCGELTHTSSPPMGPGEVLRPHCTMSAATLRTALKKNLLPTRLTRDSKQKDQMKEMHRAALNRPVATPKSSKNSVRDCTNSRLKRQHDGVVGIEVPESELPPNLTEQESMVPQKVRITRDFFAFCCVIS